eukprot:5793258-Amphidinium_carterae.1
MLTLVLRPDLCITSHTVSPSHTKWPVNDGVLRVQGDVVVLVSKAPKASSHPRDVLTICIVTLCTKGQPLMSTPTEHRERLLVTMYNEAAARDQQLCLHPRAELLEM